MPAMPEHYGVIRGIYNNLVSGPAAVIVFFVISGICVHAPHIGGNSIPSLGQYYARRFLRILPPCIVAMLMASFIFDVRLNLFEKTVLWSLFAEIIYYTIYPAILAIRRTGISWVWITVVAFIASYALVLTDPSQGNYPSYGLIGNWLLGLPCWLIGCCVVETMNRGARIPRIPIWIARAAILALSMLTSILRFHTPIGYPWTLGLFAIAIGFWLILEIRHWETTEPPSWLEWGGTWSYSLYLTHPLAMAVWHDLAFIMALAWLFYLTVERPSHRVARTASTSHSIPLVKSPKLTTRT